MFIHEDCGNLKKFIGGGELSKNIKKKKKHQTFYKLTDVHSMTNVLWESISVVSMWNIVNLTSK